MDGGHLVLTARCGMKDRSNTLLPSRQPGPLAAMAGVEVEEYYSLEAPIPLHGSELDGSVKIWAERLKLLDPAGVSVLARYAPSNGWLDDQPAITSHPHGQGLVYYVGGWVDEKTQHSLTRQIAEAGGVRPVETPDGVQLHRCTSAAAGENVTIVINHSAEPRMLELARPVREHLSDAMIEGELRLPGYGVAILTGFE